MAHGNHARTLPADLGAPAFVNSWRSRALIVGAVFAVLSILLAVLDHSVDHLLRAWLLGYMICFGFAVGGLAVLMVQYLSGGKWGLLIRRPLEAMSRTLPLVFLYFIPIGLFAKKLYLWAAISNPAQALKDGVINEAQAHAIAFKRPMLNITTMWVSTIVCFAIWGFYMWRLNALSLQRDKDKEAHVHYWQLKFENISGFGVLVYSLTMTLGVVYWVMSLDVTWYSSVYGLLFLVGQGYAVLALVIITVLSLGKGEPMKTILRTTEQHDLGKLTFAFVMLNIYLAFSQFLIIWSGNLPEEIPWYLNRFRGGWGVDRHAGFRLPLADPVYAPAFARSQAQSWPPDAGVQVDDLRSLLGYVLAYRAELPGCGAQSSLQLRHSGVRYRARSSDLRLAGLLLHPVAEAGAGCCQRSASGGNSGA